MDGPSPPTVAHALAAALLDVGCVSVTHVPGFGASATFEALRQRSGARWHLSLHEEVAYALAQGAAFRGARAAVLIKAHGLAKAANAVLASLSSGTTAGFVTLVFDDPEGRHSDNILDTPALLDGLGLPWERVATGDAFRAVQAAFTRSERQQLPVALLLDADACDQPFTGATSSSRLPPPPPYRRDVRRHIVCPLFTGYQRQVLQARIAGGDPDTVSPPPLPRLPADLPPAWQPAIQAYVPFFEAFRATPRAFTAGDTGLSSLFALPPYDCVDLVCYLGGSVPLAMGAAMAGADPAWAISGDFAFAAAGHLGLLEASLRQLPLKVAILNNGRSEATGGQALPADALDRVLVPYADRVLRLRGRPFGVEIAQALREVSQAPGLRVLVVDV